MIEAVNSVLSSASVLRANGADQASSSRAAAISLAATSDSAVSAATPQAPQAPYISPYISVDLNYNRAVLQIRDSDTGDVQQQFPTESRLRAQLQASRAAEAREQLTPQPETTPETTTNSVAATTPDIITVQDVTSAPAANVPSQLPQVAAAALSANAQSSPTSSEVSVLA